MDDCLNLICATMEAVEPVLRPEGWRKVDGSRLDELVRIGILVPGDPVDRVRCPVCANAHYESVIARTRKDRSVEHFIKCPREMRVRISASDRLTYRVDVHAVAQALALAMDLSGDVRSIASDRVYECGHLVVRGNRVDVLLARGLGRHDGDAVAAKLSRSPIPRLVLVPSIVPPATVWNADAPTVLPLRGLATLADGALTVDLRAISRTALQLLRDGETAPHIFTLKGEFWAVCFDGGEVNHFKESVGLRYIAQLLSEPRRWMAATELVEATTGIDARGALGSTGPVIDRRQRDEIRRELSDLMDQRAEAKANNSLTSHLDDRVEFLTSALEQATGLGGRDREDSDEVDRARKSVKGAIKRDIERIEKKLPDLGRHLDACIHTGRLCRYAPDREIEWLI